MQHTALNPLYEQIMGRQKGSNGLMRFKSEYEWHQVYPNLSYAPFEANELQWHYAVAFCQEMINVIRMFDLTHRFQIGNPSDLDRSITDTFSGWLVTFRIHMKNPFVRQVWLTNQTRHGNPEISAWVQYYVTDPIDADPDYFIKHQSRWDHEVAKILNRPLPTLTPTQKATSDTDH